MANIDAYGVNEIIAKRNDDEHGTLTLRIECEDGTTVTIHAGQYFDDADSLHSMLVEAAEKFKSGVLDGWQDLPEWECDGYVCEADYRDGGGYHVSLSGLFWDGDVLVPHKMAQNVKPFPTKEIAIYELASAMAHEGYFPNAWETNERGNYWPIDDEVRKYHDEGGDGMIPLEGCTFADGAEVVIDGSNATVVKDYGTELGIVFTPDYSDGKGYEHTSNRNEVVPYVVCKHCDEPIAVVTYSDSSTQWEHVNQTDDDPRVCCISENDNKWAEPDEEGDE